MFKTMLPFYNSKITKCIFKIPLVNPWVQVSHIYASHFSNENCQSQRKGVKSINLQLTSAL